MSSRQLEGKPLIFMNIGWKRNYDGWDKSDPLLGGGKWPAQHEGRGGEVCNFHEADGWVYGHVESSQGDRESSIDIGKLGGRGESVSNVDVVWTATHPSEGGTRIVGWYRNAEVFRSRVHTTPPSKAHESNQIHNWRVRALATDAVCLAVSDRTARVPRGRGGLGQRPWKVFDENSSDDVRDFLRGVRSLISGSAPSRAPQERGGDDQSVFDPSSMADGRQRIERLIVQRQGQASFRKSLLLAYGGKCAITGCAISDILEAAHISPYLGTETNHVTNGLLLRADMHTLFDRHLIRVDDQYRIVASKSVRSSYYLPKKLTLPENEKAHPSKLAIAQKYQA